MLGVIQRAARKARVMACSSKGYTSLSAMWEAAKRLRGMAEGQGAVVLYLGDHDPSGLDIPRNLERHLRLLSGGADLEFHRIALTMAQIEELNPPPSPAKLTDSRARDYVEEWGDECWELDALPPDTLVELITEKIQPYRNEDAWEETITEEKAQIARLRKLADEWDNGPEPEDDDGNDA